MRAKTVRITKLALFSFCLVLLFQPATIAVVYSGSHFEPMTEESKQWTLLFMNHRVGPNHIYGNFSYGYTFSEPPDYLEFWINNYNTSYSYADRWWVLTCNVTSAPYEWNFSTMDFEAGIHEIRVVAWDDTGGVGGGRTFFFEHQDKSGEQLLYTGASVAVTAACIVSLLGISFASYKFYKWYSSRFRRHNDSRFEKDGLGSSTNPLISKAVGFDKNC